MIYFDNAATTMKKPESVIQAVAQAMSSFGNAGRGAHAATLDASRTIFSARKKLAEFFHAESPNRMVFCANATEGLNIAIKSILQKGGHVVTTQLEHNSVLRPLYEMEEAGASLSVIASDADGCIQESDFEREIRQHTRAIICTHASNLTGNLVDIQKAGEIARRHQLLFCVDASQTAGVFPIDVQKMQIDILVFTGHKGLLGPQGTGGMYVGARAALRPLKTGGSGILSYEKKHPSQLPEALEAGTLNGHGIAGLCAALDYLQETGVDAIRNKELALARQFYEGVTQIPGIRVYGDFHTWERCPIVALNLRDTDSSRVSDELFTTYGIATRPGAHCAPLMHQALGTVSQGAVRFSFSHFNTAREVAYALSALRKLAEE